jgi:phosphatidylinositol alpha-1,6-mannosyltransferase
MADGSARPRVLFVTRNFPPLLGGMERLNWHLADELRQHCELRLVAPEGAARLAPPGVEVREVRLRPLRRFIVQAALRARREARAWRPDWVLAGSGLTAPLAWGAARACGARAAAYVHGLDLSVPHPVYRALWRPALRRMDRIIANSSATARLAGALGIDASRISIVHPGTELPEFDERARERFRQAHRIDPRAPVLLAVGRLTERKGLRQFVADVLPRIVREHPGAVFVVIGDAPANALYAQVQSPESIVQAGRDAGVDGNLRMLGKVDERELHDAYFAADLHVFPIRELPDDIEGFGMVAVEAAAHGLPTVAYACGGVVDAVAHGISGVLIQAGDGGGFAGAVLAGLERPLCQAATRGFAEGFSWEHFGAQVLRALGQDDAI